MNPMPSGGAGDAGSEGAGTAGLEAGVTEEVADLSGAAAVDEAGAPVERQHRGRRRRNRTINPMSSGDEGRIASGVTIVFDQRSLESVEHVRAMPWFLKCSR
jgi:hypothetical protein